MGKYLFSALAICAGAVEARASTKIPSDVNRGAGFLAHGISVSLSQKIRSKVCR